ncbi:hypothetical protein HKCCE2091_15770 [Rhodobacterales bacterium HKCCE2091]|nr:hypothetical protein [Rhodobacterales bacterium HKCCE2091]
MLITRTATGPALRPANPDGPGGCLGCADCKGACREILDLFQLPELLTARREATP